MDHDQNIWMHKGGSYMYGRPYFTPVGYCNIDSLVYQAGGFFYLFPYTGFMDWPLTCFGKTSPTQKAANSKLLSQSSLFHPRRQTPWTNR